jgi:hypothetical protein
MPGGADSDPPLAPIAPAQAALMQAAEETVPPLSRRLPSREALLHIQLLRECAPASRHLDQNRMVVAIAGPSR